MVTWPAQNYVFFPSFWPLYVAFRYTHIIYQKLHISDADILQQKSVRSEEATVPDWPKSSKISLVTSPKSCFFVFLALLSNMFILFVIYWFALFYLFLIFVVLFCYLWFVIVFCNIFLLFDFYIYIYYIMLFPKTILVPLVGGCECQWHDNLGITCGMPQGLIHWATTFHYIYKWHACCPKQLHGSPFCQWHKPIIFS